MGCFTILSDGNSSSPNPLFIKLAHTISGVLCTPAESRARNQHPIANLSRIPSGRRQSTECTRSLPPRLEANYATQPGSSVSQPRNRVSKSMEERIPLEIGILNAPVARAFCDDCKLHEDNTGPQTPPDCTEWAVQKLRIRSRYAMRKVTMLHCGSLSFCSLFFLY